MDLEVSGELISPGEALPTALMLTQVGLLAPVTPQVGLQVGGLLVLLIANVAAVQALELLRFLARWDHAVRAVTFTTASATSVTATVRGLW